MNDDALTDFRNALNAAALKAGQSTDGLRIDRVVTDSTWGDRVGLYFEGPNAKRAAEFFAKWYAAQRFPTSYDAQFALAAPVPFVRVKTTVNASGASWEQHLDPMWLRNFGALDGYTSERFEGFAVSYAYHPSND